MDHSANERSGSDWIGVDLGERSVAYAERDAILYALAIGAPATSLDLVHEDRLRVLPTFALTLAQWAPDVLGSRGAFDVGRAVHGAQALVVHRELPRQGVLTTRARVANVWDKGAAAIFEVEVESDCFTAVWSLFAPGAGGFGGDRGPASPAQVGTAASWTAVVPTSPNQAALYRLLGDRHAIHIDPEAAARIGMARPILHGLSTLGTCLLELAGRAGAHPADLTEVRARFAGPVLPGETVQLSGWDDGRFEARTETGPAITAAHVAFA